MRRLLTLFPFLLLLYVVQAQTLQPNVIAANGGVSQNEKISVEWTLGEPFIEGITGKERSYTEGFHQPVITIGNVESPDTRPTIVHGQQGISVYPNPVRTGLTIDLSPDLGTELHLQLISAEGATVLSQKADPTLRRIGIDMSSLAPGQYVLWFINQQDEKITAFNITKI